MDHVLVAVEAGDSITRAGVVSHLQSRPEIEVVPEQRASEADVLLVIVDVVTAEVVRRLREVLSRNRSRLVLVTTQLRQADLMATVEYGLTCVIPRSEASAERLVTAVLAAARGHGQLPPDLLGLLLRGVSRLQREVLGPRGLTSVGLASREVEVLRLMADGMDTAQIAQQLVYSERTVKNVLHGLMTRMKLRNRPHAVAYALREGLI
ncbi:response regulator transcription factor [Solihabitans fulvus]|uniref:Response regulator transcription factor n=1 Tax=Solihabitans fulvus TaxID=1892852 RepID=A0A5B2WVZ8_9PSEU|nr:LuxR C-terminal-related transcriptional regulator [Solihabitans fulvus]KAA2255238.1 response regulator transcription factor [Solihabitans fulvus]